MCGGPSSTQLDLQSEEADFYRTQVQAYNNAYSNFSSLQTKLNDQFAPILAKGINQYGFSDAEDQTLRTQATEGTATEYAKAQKALNEGIATQGGGTNSINTNSGPSTMARESLAATGAATQSAEDLSITEAGYEQGRQNFNAAATGEEELAAGWNPNSFAGSATSAAGTANSEANTITQQQESVWGSVLGALGGVASNVTYGGGKGWGLG